MNIQGMTKLEIQHCADTVSKKGKTKMQETVNDKPKNFKDVN